MGDYARFVPDPTPTDSFFTARTAGPSECTAICRSQPNCRSWRYNTTNNECDLKSHATPVEQSLYTVGGTILANESPVTANRFGNNVVGNYSSTVDYASAEPIRSHPTAAPVHHAPAHAPAHVSCPPVSHGPTKAPHHAPSRAPTHAPTHAPHYAPVYAPVNAPAHAPSHAPRYAPVYAPVHAPTHAPAHSIAPKPIVCPPRSAPARAPTHAPAPLSRPQRVSTHSQGVAFPWVDGGDRAYAVNADDCKDKCVGYSGCGRWTYDPSRPGPSCTILQGTPSKVYTAPHAQSGEIYLQQTLPRRLG